MSRTICKPVLALLGAVLAAAAGAQQSVVDRCRQTSSDADRIACLEAALLARDAGTAPLPADEPPSGTEPAPPAPLPAAPPADEPAGSDVEGIGAEQVLARRQTAEEMRASLERAPGMRVVKYEEIPYRRLQVTLENGQVWRQIKGDTQHIRADLERNQTVDISESSLGGYRMRFNEMERTLRVQRVK